MGTVSWRRVYKGNAVYCYLGHLGWNIDQRLGCFLNIGMSILSCPYVYVQSLKFLNLNSSKKQAILGFKICPKKQVILLYLESACTCKNQLLLNMDNKQGQTWSFYLPVNLSQNFQDNLYTGTQGVSITFRFVCFWLVLSLHLILEPPSGIPFAFVQQFY